MKFLQGLSSSYYGWAFHSESEEELLAMVPPVLRGEATWSELRRYGIGWWVRSNDTLRRLIEKVTKKLLHYREGYSRKWRRCGEIFDVVNDSICVTNLFPCRLLKHNFQRTKIPLTVLCFTWP